MATNLRVLGIAGSLRKASTNRGLLRAAAQVVPEGMSLEIFDIAPIPLYDGDVEAEGFPQPVREFREAIRAADALLIACPEYNYSVPGVLKNAIDWASRGADQPLADKPVAIIGSSAGMLGTARAQYHLRQICVVLNMHPLNRPELFIPSAGQKFAADGTLTDETIPPRIAAVLEALGAWTRRLRGE